MGEVLSWQQRPGSRNVSVSLPTFTRGPDAQVEVAYLIMSHVQNMAWESADEVNLDERTAATRTRSCR